MHRNTICIYAIVFFFFCISCGKLGKDEGPFVYTLTNTTARKVQCNIYTTQQDYNLGQNAYKQYMLTAGEQVTVPMTALQNYYFDWYSETYTYTNWITQTNSSAGVQAQPAVLYNAPKINDNLKIVASTVYGDTSRSIILNGNGWGSKWLAAQEYSGGTAVTGKAKYIELTLLKDFTAEMKELDNTGDTIVSKIFYTISNSGGTNRSIAIQLLATKDAGQNYFASINYNASISSFPHTTRDTLMSTFYGSAYKYYSFVREQ